MYQYTEHNAPPHLQENSKNQVLKTKYSGPGTKLSVRGFVWRLEGPGFNSQHSME